MSFSDRPVHYTANHDSVDISRSGFFQDAYEKGVVSAVAQHPVETALTVAAVSAAVCLTKGAVVKSGVVKEAQAARPAGAAMENVIASKVQAVTESAIPISGESRAAASGLDQLVAPERASMIRGLSGYAEHAAGDAKPAVEGIFGHRQAPLLTQKEVDAVLEKFLNMPEAEWEAVIKSRANSLYDAAGTSSGSPFSALEHSGYTHVPFRPFSEAFKPTLQPRPEMGHDLRSFMADLLKK